MRKLTYETRGESNGHRRCRRPPERRAGRARSVLRPAVAGVARGVGADAGAVSRHPGLRAVAQARSPDSGRTRESLRDDRSGDAGRTFGARNRRRHPLSRPHAALRAVAAHRIRDGALPRIQPLADRGMDVEGAASLRGDACLPAEPGQFGARNRDLWQRGEDRRGLPANGGRQSTLGAPQIRPDLRGGGSNGPAGGVAQRNAGLTGVSVPDRPVREPLRAPIGLARVRDDVKPGKHHAHRGAGAIPEAARSEEHTSELQSLTNLVCRLLLEKKKNPKSYENLTKQPTSADT